MCESLFKLNESQSESDWRYTEPEIDFLRRSSRGSVEQDRNAIDAAYQKFYNKLGDRDSKDLRARLLKKDREQHIGAISELYTFELCHQRDLMVDCHPPLDHTSNRPDFLVTSKNGQKFYIEVKAILHDKRRDGIQKAQAEFNDAVNRVRDPNFLISYTIMSASENDPQAHFLRRDIERRIKKLSSADNGQIYKWMHEGWKLEVEISRRNTRRDPNGNNLGMFLETEFHEITVYNDIIEGIEGKRKKYGTLKYPYIIVLNVHTPDGPDWMDNNDVERALYGSLITGIDSNHHVISNKRDADGVFQKKQVTGVIILRVINSVGYSTVTKQPTIWLKSKDNIWIAQEMGLPARFLGENGVTTEEVSPKADY